MCMDAGSWVPPRVFYLGMMNVCEVSKDDHKVLEILDGQQRLVILCLILAAIRKKLLDHGGVEEIDYANGFDSCCSQLVRSPCIPL